MHVSLILSLLKAPLSILGSLFHKPSRQGTLFLLPSILRTTSRTRYLAEVNFRLIYKCSYIAPFAVETMASSAIPFYHQLRRGALDFGLSSLELFQIV